MVHEVLHPRKCDTHELFGVKLSFHIRTTLAPSPIGRDDPLVPKKTKKAKPLKSGGSARLFCVDEAPL